MTKTEKYQELYKQLQSLLSGEYDQIANMANMAALIHETFGFWWTGFYIVKGEQLVLGPFQGPIACTRIPYSKVSAELHGRGRKQSSFPTLRSSQATSPAAACHAVRS